jgi:hypothetical protein
MNNIFDFVYKGWHMYDPDILVRKDNKRTKIIHTYKLNLNLSDFNISIEQKKKMLDLGYDSMKEHFIGLQ